MIIYEVINTLLLIKYLTVNVFLQNRFIFIKEKCPIDLEKMFEMLHVFS